jgi:hypothetical protein
MVRARSFASAHGDPSRHPIHHSTHRGDAHVKDGMVRLTEAPRFGHGDRPIDLETVEKFRSAE